MSDDKSLELPPLASLAQAVPEQAWLKIVNTACQTFQDFLAPITALTSGTGRLITAKFDRLVDAEKILLAGTLEKANEKIRRAPKRRTTQPQASTIIAALDLASNHGDINLQELWANLLANEIIQGEIHPEIPKILARLTTPDAMILAQLAEHEAENFKKRFFHALLKSLPAPAIGLTILPSDKTSFNHAHLRRLELITRIESIWRLTVTGRTLIKAVSDPDDR